MYLSTETLYFSVFKLMLHALLSTAVLAQLADDFNMVMDDNVNAFGCMIHFYLIIQMYLIDLIYSELFWNHYD